LPMVQASANLSNMGVLRPRTELTQVLAEVLGRSLGMLYVINLGDGCFEFLLCPKSLF
jgi:hypothetical protein